MLRLYRKTQIPAPNKNYADTRKRSSFKDFFCDFVINIMEEEVPFRIVELAPHRTLFKKGDFYNSFFELLSGEVELFIGQMSISFADPIFLGDYEIIEGIDYRLSTVKTLSRCCLKVFDRLKYSALRLFHKEYEKAFDKFNFRSRPLNYLLKKLFVLQGSKRGDQVGEKNNIGVILEGQYKIDRNIQIVKMKVKNLQLLKKFEICLVGAGQIFKGELVCESTTGFVGLCRQRFVEELMHSFEEFRTIFDMAQFKGEVHDTMEKDILSQCQKRSKLYQHMVPLPLKEHVRTQEIERYQTLEKEKTRKEAPMRSSRFPKDVFEIENNITTFFHQQFRKGLSLNLKRRDLSLEVSPPKKYRNSKKKVKRVGKLNLQDPILVNLSKFKLTRKIRQKQIRFKLLTQMKEPLPQVNSIRLKTEGSDSLRHYLKVLNFE